MGALAPGTCPGETHILSDKESLHGHLESSAPWLRHADAVLRPMGGVEFDSLKSCYYFPSAQLCLAVYVDDFTLSGLASAHNLFGDELGARTKLEVGRAHLETALDGQKSLAMQATEFAQSCVERCQELSSMPVRSPKTPHLDDGSLVADDFLIKGELHATADRIIMKVLWLANQTFTSRLMPWVRM